MERYLAFMSETSIYCKNVGDIIPVLVKTDHTLSTFLARREGVSNVYGKIRCTKTKENLTK